MAKHIIQIAFFLGLAASPALGQLTNSPTHVFGGTSGPIPVTGPEKHKRRPRKPKTAGPRRSGKSGVADKSPRPAEAKGFKK